MPTSDEIIRLAFIGIAIGTVLLIVGCAILFVRREYFSGQAAEIGFYNRQLSAREATRLYQSIANDWARH